MPIEIKELHIKAYVDDTSSKDNLLKNTDKKSYANTDAIIAACVEQVLQILKDKEER